MIAIGLDVHKAFSHVSILDTDTGVLEDFRINSDRPSVRQALSEYTGNSRVALEASSHWYWVVDELQEMGFDVVLSHPTKTKAIGSAKIKTDKIDASMLCRLLAADMLPQAHICDPTVRELRSYLRHRCALVNVRTQAKNHIHSVLAGYGLKCPVGSVFSQKGRSWLSSQALRPLHREEVDRYIELIELISGQVLQIDEKIKLLADEHEDTRILMTIPGIGYFGALLIAAEIDGVERFGSAKQLVSYAGLCPSTRSSGGKDKHGHITRCGSRYLRWILVEAAQHAMRGGSPLNRFYWSIAKRKGAGTARVAVARKLLESIYQMLKKRQDFAPALWAGKSRSGVASANA